VGVPTAIWPEVVTGFMSAGQRRESENVGFLTNDSDEPHF